MCPFSLQGLGQVELLATIPDLSFKGMLPALFVHDESIPLRVGTVLSSLSSDSDCITLHTRLDLDVPLEICPGFTPVLNVSIEEQDRFPPPEELASAAGMPPDLLIGLCGMLKCKVNDLQFEQFELRLVGATQIEMDLTFIVLYGSEIPLLSLLRQFIAEMNEAVRVVRQHSSTGG
jgi:hypothetical protein